MKYGVEPVKIPKYYQQIESGSQPKWLIGGKYYKMDRYGYEGLAETVASDMLAKSNIENAVHYDPVVIAYEKHVRPGCVSDSFLKDGEKKRDGNDILFDQNWDLQQMLAVTEGPDNAMTAFNAFVENDTGIWYRRYLCKLLEFDQLVLNDDRNAGNLVFARSKEGEWRPVTFDHGHAFNNINIARHPLADPLKNCPKVILPFTTIYGEQVPAAEKLCGGEVQLQLSYGLKDLDASLDRCRGIYSDRTIERCRKVIQTQMVKNPQYFTKDVQEELRKLHFDRVRDAEQVFDQYSEQHQRDDDQFGGD